MRTLGPLTAMFGGAKIVENNTRYTLFCHMIAIGRGFVQSLPIMTDLQFWALPVIFWGRHILKTHPDAEAICDYLQNQWLFVGHFLVPQKYSARYQEKHRAAQYEYYLRRGLPIPAKYMPKDVLEEGKQPVRYMLNGKKLDGLRKKTDFQPEISVNFDTSMEDTKASASKGSR